MVLTNLCIINPTTKRDSGLRGGAELRNLEMVVVRSSKQCAW